MAELAVRIGRLRDAEALPRRPLELAPGFAAARANLATVFYKQNRFAEAAAELDTIVAAGGANPASRNLMAAALGRAAKAAADRYGAR
jgi:predicted Zn-dependent protease